MQKQDNKQCKYFRIENSHVPGKDVSQHWPNDEHSSKQFYCIQTMTQAGPDTGLVSPKNCLEQRKCFEIK